MDVTQHRILPRGGLSLPCIGMGCAPLGGLYQPISDAQARATLDGAWDAGVRFFDTAPYYGYTQSEHRLGAALRERPRNEFVISTKVGRLLRPDASVRPGDDGFAAPLPFRPHYDYTYDGILRSHEDSLQRLGLARIDIAFVHDIGSVTHGERDDHYWRQLTSGGGFRALDQLRSSGQVKAVGLGVNECEIVLRAMGEFDLDCTLLAGRYTLLEQASLSPLLDLCLERGNASSSAGRSIRAFWPATASSITPMRRTPSCSAWRSSTPSAANSMCLCLRPPCSFRWRILPWRPAYRAVRTWRSCGRTWTGSPRHCLPPCGRHCRARA